MSVHAVRLTVAIMSIVTLAMYLVCVSTDYWQKTSYGDRNTGQQNAVQGTHSGIWHGCYIKEHQEFCGHIHLEKHWLRAVRAFMIMGIIANLVAVIYVVLAFIKEPMCFKPVGYILLVNAVMILIGLAVYATKSGIPFSRGYEEGKFDWSFIVAWVTWVLTIIATVVAFLDGHGDDIFQE